MNIRDIPKTSYSKYISGYYSLNTPDSNGNIANWHSYYYWDKDNSKSKIELYKNKFLLGNEGIEYRNIVWCENKVYIADFLRSIADILIENDKDKVNLLKNCVKDYLTDIEANKLYKYCLKIREYVDIKSFVKREFLREYVEDIEIWN